MVSSLLLCKDRNFFFSPNELEVLMQTYDFQKWDFRQMSYIVRFLVRTERVGDIGETELSH